MTAADTFTSPCKGEVGRETAGRGSKFARTRKMTSRARVLRSTPTTAEQKLWSAIRRNQINGFSFRRQHPIGPYTLDFFCPALGLAIEVDGGQHAEQDALINDARRTRWLRDKGVRVLRYWNNDVLGNLEGVLTDLSGTVAQIAAQRMTPSPTLPLSGGGSSGSVP